MIGFPRICHDLIERRAQEALVESEERNRLIVEQATEYAVFSTGRQRWIKTWTSGASAVHGWTAEEAIGQLIDITHTPEGRAAGVPTQDGSATPGESC